MKALRSPILKAVAVIMLVVAAGIGSFAFYRYSPFTSCSYRKTQLHISERGAIADFNAATIYDGAAFGKTSIDEGGDCFDSNPSLIVYKAADIDATGAEALLKLKATMERQGFAQEGDALFATDRQGQASAELTFKNASTTYRVRLKEAQDYNNTSSRGFEQVYSPNFKESEFAKHHISLVYAQFTAGDAI
jgi:hypothetical protein